MVTTSRDGASELEDQCSFLAAQVEGLELMNSVMRAKLVGFECAGIRSEADARALSTEHASLTRSNIEMRKNLDRILAAIEAAADSYQIVPLDDAETTSDSVTQKGGDRDEECPPNGNGRSAETPTDTDFALTLLHAFTDEFSRRGKALAESRYQLSEQLAELTYVHGLFECWLVCDYVARVGFALATTVTVIAIVSSCLLTLVWSRCIPTVLYERNMTRSPMTWTLSNRDTVVCQKRSTVCLQPSWL